MKKTVIFFMAIMMLFLISCSKSDDNGNTGKPNESGDNVYPFTGLPAEAGVNNRAVSVMVSNQEGARPQTGLSQADIVFEILTEGNVTRFMAIFQSEQPEVVGPVRSAREYFFNLADAYDVLYVYHGAAKVVTEKIESSQVEYLNGALHDNDGKLFKREAFRKKPHNSYLQFGAVYEEAEEKGYDIEFNHEPLPFIEDVNDIEGETATHAKIAYYENKPIVQYEYDAAAEKYTRYNDGEKTVELESDEPIQVDNVFIIETEHEVIDEQKRRVVDLNSGGKAYLLQKGFVQQIEWKNENGRIVPVKDGQVVGFVPGQTWINIVPTDPGMEQSVTLTNE